MNVSNLSQHLRSLGQVLWMAFRPHVRSLTAFDATGIPQAIPAPGVLTLLWWIGNRADTCWGREDCVSTEIVWAVIAPLGGFMLLLLWAGTRIHADGASRLRLGRIAMNESDYTGAATWELMVFNDGSKPYRNTKATVLGVSRFTRTTPTHALVGENLNWPRPDRCQSDVTGGGVPHRLELIRVDRYIAQTEDGKSGPAHTTNIAYCGFSLEEIHERPIRGPSLRVHVAVSAEAKSTLFISVIVDSRATSQRKPDAVVLEKVAKKRFDLPALDSPIEMGN